MQGFVYFALHLRNEACFFQEKKSDYVIVLSQNKLYSSLNLSKKKENLEIEPQSDLL